MSFFVYIHTCPNQKRYVGITTKKPELRWGNGKGYHTNNHFYRAIQKYGWDNIEHEVFETQSKELMFYWEKILIYHYNTMDSEFGYNKSVGGEGPIGVKHTEEAKRNMSNAHLGYKVTKETKIKISQTLKGRRIQMHTKETCMKISQTLKGRKLSEETRKKISEAGKRRKHSEETRKKMSESAKGRVFSEETRKKMSESAKNRKQRNSIGKINEKIIHEQSILNF